MRSIIVICAVVGFVAALATLHSGAAPVQTEPGMMLYTPTRLEWLALDLEASYHQDFGSDSDYSLHYITKPPNTVLIVVHYTSNASVKTVDDGIDSARELVKQTAISHGWSPWVKIEVSRNPVKK